MALIIESCDCDRDLICMLRVFRAVTLAVMVFNTARLLVDWYLSMQGISWGADVILVSVSPSKLRDSVRRFYLLADSAASLGQLIPVAIFFRSFDKCRHADRMILSSLGCV